MKLNKKQMKIINKHFRVYEDESCVELETTTYGGVNMFITLRKDKEENFITQLENYCKNFDIDEEIDLMRENKKYRQIFTIRESLEDYESYIEEIKNIIKELKGEQKK